MPKGKPQPLSNLPLMNAVRIGSIYHKPSVINELLSKSVRLVAHEHVYEGESTLGLGGSCTLVSYGGQAFVVATRHQLHIPPTVAPLSDQLATLRVATSVNGHLKNILVDGCYFEELNYDQEYHDLVFFHVNTDWLRSSSDRVCFFPVDNFRNVHRKITYFYGHPMSKSEIKYHPLHAIVRIAFIDGYLETNEKSNAEYLRLYRYYKKGYEVNGFSGGAVFSLIGDIDTELEIVLDGIIVRGGNGHFHVVDSSYLKLALSKFH